MKVKKSLLLVADSHVGKFYLVENFKISSQIFNMKVDDVCVHHQKPECGRFPKSGNYRAFAPHNEPKDIDRQCFSRNIAHELNKLLEQEKYVQLILVCGAKILGDIRKHLPEHWIKTLDVKEFKKDLINKNTTELEHDVLEQLKFN